MRANAIHNAEAMKKKLSPPTELKEPVNTGVQDPIEDEQDFDLGVWENVKPEGEYPPASKLNIRVKSGEPSRQGFLAELSGDGPASKVLAGLFDEWRSTGISKDGEERPFARDPWATVNARRMCENFLERYPPQMILGSGVHYVFLPQVPASALLAAFIGGPYAPSTSSDCAIEAFINFLGMKWCFEIAKCGECGRYFDMCRAPKESYGHGIHCPRAGCQRAQANKGALAATQKARVLRKIARLVLAAKTMRSWREPAVKPNSEAILKKANRAYPLEVKRLRLSAHWITRHREEIEQIARGEYQFGETDKDEAARGAIQAR
jgi:hypothetical protein